MPATLAQKYSLFTSAMMLGRVIAAVATAATYILTESPATPNHAERLAWARETLLNPELDARRCMLFVATNEQIATAENASPGSSSDSDIQWCVDTMIPTLAGYTPA